MSDYEKQAFAFLVYVVSKLATHSGARFNKEEWAALDSIMHKLDNEIPWSLEELAGEHHD